MENGQFVPGAAGALRQQCVAHIEKNPDVFTELQLGQDANSYCVELLKDFTWGGETEILILAELKNVVITVVPLDSLVPLSYSPPESKRPHIGTIFILYTGQHYDAMIHRDEKGDTFIFSTPSALAGADEASPITEVSATAAEVPTTVEAAAIACAREHREAWERQLRLRKRKRIKCLGCGSLLLNAEAFQVHCTDAEAEAKHGQDFMFDCEDVEITEMVDSPDDD